jgi:zinc transport system ATP-binding protein
MSDAQIPTPPSNQHLPTAHHHTPENGHSPELHPLHQMRVDQLSVRRGNRLLIENVSLTIRCGEMAALVGPNGGGKSTLLRAMIGEIPYKGTVHFGDASGHSIDRPRIGYMPQHMLFDRQSPLTVADFLGANRSVRPVFLGLGKKRREEIRELLAQVEGENLIDQRLGVLSGGELQRVSLAFALDPMPDILLLDEPVAALDKNGRALFYRLVQSLRDRYDLLTLIVTHDLAVIRNYATHAYYLNGTILAGGRVSDLISDPDTVSYFAALEGEF